MYEQKIKCLIKDCHWWPNLVVTSNIGEVSQTICLTALEYGLGTCIESQGIKFPEVLR